MIHPTAIIADGSRIHASVEIGPYSIIGPQVTIDEGSRVGSHVVIQGRTRIGKNNRIYHFACLGEVPQDKKYQGEDTLLEIGHDNTIREYCTISLGTVQDQGITRIGNQNWIMAYVHIAHDCILGNNIIMANNASLAGHVKIDDHVVLGGFALVHQFCKIGSYAMLAAGSVLFKDVPPYVMASDYNAKPYGLNVEGLRRHQFSSEDIMQLKRAYKTIYRSEKTLAEAMESLQEQSQECHRINLLLNFMKTTTRGIIR